MKDITEDCAIFICLTIKKPFRIPSRVPNKSLIIIALGRLHPKNGIFHGVDLLPGGCVVISGDKPQYFDAQGEGGGLGIVLPI